MGMLDEFKDFALKGNVVDMAVGIVIGGAFGTIIKSLVDDVIMPPIGMLMGNVDFSALAINLGTGADGKDVLLKYGSFINSVLAFLIVAFALFMVIKAMNAAKKKFEEEEAKAPAEPPRQEVLLEEIRDALKK